MKPAALNGIDLGKHSFHLHAQDRSGREVFRKKTTRQQLMRLLVNQPACTVAMEAGAGSHCLAREIKALDKEIASQPDEDDVGSRLLPIPGLGPTTASVLAAEMCDGKQYASSRDFAASVGLVPRQYSTGGRANLLGISGLFRITRCDSHRGAGMPHTDAG